MKDGRTTLGLGQVAHSKKEMAGEGATRDLGFEMREREVGDLLAIKVTSPRR